MSKVHCVLVCEMLHSFSPEMKNDWVRYVKPCVRKNCLCCPSDCCTCVSEFRNKVEHHMCDCFAGLTGRKVKVTCDGPSQMTMNSCWKSDIKWDWQKTKHTLICPSHWHLILLWAKNVKMIKFLGWADMRLSSHSKQTLQACVCLPCWNM